MPNSSYVISGKFDGVEGIVAGFRQIETAAKNTHRSIKEGAKDSGRIVLDTEKEAMRLRRQSIGEQRLALREMRHEYRALQGSLKEDLALVGAGVAGAGLFTKGVAVASDFEASMTELRLSIQRLGKDGSVDVGLLNSQLGRLEKLSVDLGNRLPGSTKDFVDGLISLKQGGIETEIALNGAGEAAAYLAVMTKELPKDVGKPFGQLGMMFELKGEEYNKSADLLARLYRATGSKPGELIEGAKYFQPRAGSPLGLKGYEGFETGVTLLGLLQRHGLQGTVGGTELAGMMGRLTFHRKQQKKTIAELHGQGINLDFFNKDGKFSGPENFMAQLEKLRGLPQKKRLEVFSKLFGEEHKGAADALMGIGVKGYKEFQSELNAIPPLQRQINELTETLTAKWETLTGTGSNAVARTFLPTLERLKPLLDSANSGLAQIEKFATNHPQIAGFAGELLAVSSASFVVVGGLKAAYTAVQMWKLATRIATGESALIGMLRGAGDAASGATGKVGGLGAKLRSLPGSLKISLAVVGAVEVIHQLFELYKAHEAYEKAQAQADKGIETGAEDYKKYKERYESDPKFRKGAERHRDRDLKDEAELAFMGMDKAFTLQRFLKPESLGFFNFLGSMLPPFHGLPWGQESRSAELRHRAPTLEHPEVMSKFLSMLDQNKLPVKDPLAKQRLKKELELAFPDSFNQATKELSNSLTSQRQQIEGAAGSIRNDFIPAVKDAASALGSLKPSSTSGTTGGRPALVRSNNRGFLKPIGLPTYNPKRTSAPPAERGTRGGTPAQVTFAPHVPIQYVGPDPKEAQRAAYAGIMQARHDLFKTIDVARKDRRPGI